MSFITKFALNTLLQKTHPTLTRKECWNIRSHKDKCSACIDICPHGADVFKRAGVVNNWEQCIDCGLCVSVCKTRCIAPSRHAVDADTSAVELPDDTVWIGCTQSKRQNNIVRECIGALSWETLAYIALAKKIVLDVTPCGACENEACAEHLRNMLARTAEFLGPHKFEARIALAYEEDELPFVRQEFSRRDLMGKVTTGSKVNSKKVLRKMPFLQEETDGHQYDFRKMLHDRIKYLKSQAETPATYGFKVPIITEKCYGCEKCVTACKPQALKMVPAGEGYSKLVLTAWRCNECEQCKISCTEHAIDHFELRQVSTLGPIGLKTMPIYICPSCGKVKKPNPKGDTCVTCEIRERSKERQERSRIRLEEIKKERAEKAAAKAAEEAAKAAAEAAQPVVEPAAEQVIEQVAKDTVIPEAALEVNTIDKV